MTSENDTPYTDEFDWETTPPSTAVVEAVCTATDREVQDIDPLYESLDPDALDRLLEAEAARGADLQFEFLFSGTRVTVRADGQVIVVPQ
ncbi:MULTISPECIES: HalOD1 output domain-containing protein [Salinibaculum]|uniref:HalOD1 output domain-containing protein n=1 Tax=Salinibaculum TaxID=2732368 RepID=UPI0030CD75BD